ncbi:MAG: hypothetical protein RPU60_02640 [Candidatus Sedimenticola sp. (ex Thyasira tokunagai)]
MAEEETENKEKLFGVIAEKEGLAKQLVLLNIPFGRLLDEIIVPYDNGESFFIDGAPVTNEQISRIKIVELGREFEESLWRLERGLNRGDSASKKIYGDQYQTRFEHILRTNAVDVTAQVIKAYNTAIKPSIKDYMPNRKELIGAATKVFVEGMRALSS